MAARRSAFFPNTTTTSRERGVDVLCTKSEVSLNEEKSALFLSAFFSPNVVFRHFFIAEGKGEKERERKRVEKPSSGRRGDVVGEERRRGRRRRGGARL